MPPTVQLVRTPFSARTADELLRAPVTALLGVPEAAAPLLAEAGIHSVFDLAASRVFGAARRLVTLAEDADSREPESRLNRVPADVVAAPDGVPLAELAEQPVSILRGFGENASDLSDALGLVTVRDLALWPPYGAARALLAAAFFPEQAEGFDREAPADLLPKFGEYPTERVFYQTLLMDGPATEPANAAPLEQIGEAIDIVPGLLNPTGFQQITTGALLTFSQSWFSQGLTLGQLLHSTALAPGESTRIAMVDWTRRSSASTSEDIDETEQLSASQLHNRALTEVTSGTASEIQAGVSSTTATSSTSQSGGGFGIEVGPLALGGSGGSSTTTTEVISSSSSFGLRNVASNYAQNINDRTQQQASSARSRRASIVREVSQSEHETISTRVVTNYNHMHALSVQYYEVVQAFRVTTQLERTERCLFVPVTLLDFQNVATIERWRVELTRGALSPGIARALAELGTVRVITRVPRPLPFLTAVPVGLSAVNTFSSAAVATNDSSTGDDENPKTPTTEKAAEKGQPYVAPVTRLGRFSAAGWDLSQLDRLARLSGRLFLPSRTHRVNVSDDAMLLGVSLRQGQATRFVVLRQDGSSVTLKDVTAARADVDAPLPLGQLHSISMQASGTTSVTTSLTLQLSLFGALETLDVPIALPGASAGLVEIVRFERSESLNELRDHLQAYRLHYTQAVLRSLDGPSVATLLSRFTFRGLPLAQLVDQRPVAVSANLLVFRMNLPPDADAVDERLQADLEAWRAFLSRTGLDRPAPKSEIVPLPSGGVFAEAVLGRFNSAELLDLQRFWNWQDSPIPLVASEISAIEAGSRSKPEDLTPGQLSAPVVTIQNPTPLPDPTPLAAVLAAVQNGGIFRNMSGLEQSAAIAQAAQQASAAGATAVAKQAAQNLQTVMEQNTERMRIAAQVAATLMGVPAAGAGGGKPPAGKDTVTERGGELRQAAQLDSKQATGAEGGGAAAGNTPSATEADTFRTQMGLKGRAIAQKVLEAAGLPPELAAGPSSSPPANRSVGPTLAAPQPIPFELQISSHFSSTSIFPGPVTVDTSISDLGGKQLFSHRGPATTRLNGTLRTSDERLSWAFEYAYSLAWPQATPVKDRRNLALNTPAGTKQVHAHVIVLSSSRTLVAPTGTATATDADLVKILTDNAVDLKTVLAKPTVAATADGVTLTFPVLQAVVLEQGS